MIVRRPPPLATLAIGSLPHTQLEMAMQQALQLDIATLPQLPRFDASEYMLAQALEGLPGLRFDAEGRTTIDASEWERGRNELGRRLARATGGGDPAAFEPGCACRAWKPFLWEVEERRLPFAKAQVAGPVTVRWATRLADGRPLADAPGLETQLVELVIARALAMAQALRGAGAQPVVFLDEPGLLALDPHRPAHALELAQLKMAATALRRAGALVGVHCCGNTDWAALLGTGLDYVSADMRLSGRLIAHAGPALDAFLAGGGALVAGVVPTGSPERVEPADLVAGLLDELGDQAPRLLSGALLSPACGLAMRSVSDSEQVYDDLRETQRLLRRGLG